MEPISQKITIGDKKYKIKITPRFGDDGKEYVILFNHEDTLFGMKKHIPFDISLGYYTVETMTAVSMNDAVEKINQYVRSELEKIDTSDSRKEAEQQFNDGLSEIADNVDEVSLM